MRTPELAYADLPDVNVWLALAVREHPFHGSAAHWWNTAAAESVMVCRVTALGLVRLLGQPRVMGAGALSVDAALGVYEAFLGLGEVRWLEEPPGVDQLWRSLFRSHQLGHRHGTDAYLAALALSRRLRLVTFDRDFQRFSDLDVLLLSAGEGS
jgi:uncharacterized protein